MKELVVLFFEFFRTGLFAIGGGMATLPFLQDIGLRTGWYSSAELMNMLALSESTPGPIGINMATYVGYTVAGIPGALIATLGEVTPCVLVILMIAALWQRFRDSRAVDHALYGLRPASVGLIASACVTAALEVFACLSLQSGSGLWKHLVQGPGAILSWKALVLAAALLALTRWVPVTRKWHPIVWIGVSALAGVLFHFGGV